MPGRIAATIACILLLLDATAQQQPPLDEAFERDVIVIAANDYVCYRFDVYLALSTEQKRRGLMFVRELPEMTGMLFVYNVEDYHSMWMKNTYIPLDILFARANGEIVYIARHTEPQSLESIGPAVPVTYVVELNAGMTVRLGIDVGSRLLPATDPGED